jgi:fucose permease
MWRGVSLRKLGLLVLGPMLTESLVTLYAAWMVWYAEKSLGYEPWEHMAIPVAGSIGYAGSAFVAGRWVTPRVAMGLMIGTILLIPAIGLFAVALKSFAAFIAVSFLIGVTIGHYYTPFQINMTHVRPFHTLAWSVAFYNVAWGTGAALGPFYGSSMRTASVWLLGSVGAALALMHTVLAVISRYAPPPAVEIDPARAFNSTPRQRRMGLVGFVTVNSMIRGLYITLWPHLGDQRGWTDAQVGFGQFCMFALVPIGSLAWARLRYRIERPWILLGTMVVGLAGFASLPWVASYGAALVCVTSIALVESCMVFHAIYYVNADPDPHRRGRNIALFEACAGLAGVIGPVSLGTLAWAAHRWGPTWMPYGVASAVVAAAIAYVLVNARSAVPAPLEPSVQSPR